MKAISKKPSHPMYRQEDKLSQIIKYSFLDKFTYQGIVDRFCILLEKLVEREILDIEDINDLCLENSIEITEDKKTKEESVYTCDLPLKKDIEIPDVNTYDLPKVTPALGKWDIIYNNTVKAHLLWNGTNYEVYKTKDELINRLQEACQDLEDYLRHNGD